MNASNLLTPLAPEHAALVQRVIKDARGPEPLLLLADYYDQLAAHLGAGGLRLAEEDARLGARMLRDHADQLHPSSIEIPA